MNRVLPCACARFAASMTSPRWSTSSRHEWICRTSTWSVRSLRRLRSTLAAIVSGVITLAHNLGRKVVAEGVETMEQLAFLRSKECDLVQGYLISPPLQAEETSILWERRIELLTGLSWDFPCFVENVTAVQISA